MKEGDSVDVPNTGPWDHPGVILRIEGEWALVCHGTGEERRWPCEIVEPKTNIGRAFNATKTTYFYAKNISWMKTSVLKKRRGFCHPELSIKLKAFSQKYAKDKLAETPWIEDAAGDGVSIDVTGEERSHVTESVTTGQQAAEEGRGDGLAPPKL